MLDHPRSAIVGISSVLKFGLDPICSFGVIAIFIFCRFGLKLPIHAHFFFFFWGVLGAYFPQISTPIVRTPKRTIFGRKHVVWALRRENRSSGSTWVQDREKKLRTGQDSQKSHKVVTFRLFGEKPPLHETKIGMVGQHNHVCKVLRWHFQWSHFYRLGSNFSFSY